jgi:predicted ester cyclase
MRVTIEELIACGDRVVARTAMQATHTEPLGDLPPTGRRLHLAAVVI